MSRVISKPCCKVCKDAGKSAQEYGSHWPKDKDGVTVCPTLLSQECRYCEEMGHTVKYCPVLARSNAEAAKRLASKERLKRIQAHEESQCSKQTQRNVTFERMTGRFAMLMDDDSSDESPRSPKRTQKKAPVALKEEFPALGGTWRKSSVAPEVAKTSFMEIAVKSKEVALAEKQTRETRAEEERIGRAIAMVKVIIERGSKGVVMTHPPKTANMEREKAVHRMECFKGLNGKGWGDLDSDDEEEDQLEQVAEDAW
jgi:Nanos RNA binding domain